MRALLLCLVITGGCRRKHAAVETETRVAPPEATPQVVETPNAVETPLAPPEKPTGHAPTDDEIRVRLKPLFPSIARCIKKTQEPLGLRFTISPNGAPLMVTLDGQPEATPCVADVMRELRFEPWSGMPSLVALPLTAEGQPVMIVPDGGGAR